jgi:hypothetical protein
MLAIVARSASGRRETGTEELDELADHAASCGASG